ncbi:uncharacterized protein LOC129586473 [Paramacrobiotus metropolitanus]|uniref:uncharacterized protein LOC129586473 n=1 Tax=Paramacrobiotus metropolitanus TaxID=2943436 RepID=UPI00244633DF|nr:uncharacterized protein LOC129586473 [Paramacrobiotus metropolitanus]
MPKDSIQYFTYRDLQTYRTYSYESMQWLHFVMQNEHIEIQHARNHPDGEKRIGRYKVDGFYEAANTVFEYHGCYFHGCPKCYTADAVTNGNQNMAQLLQATKHKQRYLETRGYSYRSIWSCEWKSLRQGEEIKKALKSFCHTEPMNVRDVLFGGRTEAFRLLNLPDTSSGRYISYLDKNSLYPAVCKQKEYPLGLPDRILSDFKPLDQYFGIAHVRVLPPSNLPLPLLPQRINGKCMFALCWRCAEANNQETSCTHTDEERSFNGVYTTPEVNLAVSLGYRILAIHEVWHYSKRGNLFADYISTFMAEKAAASGFPSHCQSDGEKQAYLQSLKDRDNVVVDDPGKVEFNPTRRLLSKLMLNTLWGRLAIKENKPSFEYVKSVKRFNELFYSGKYTVNYIDVVNEDVLQVQSTKSSDLDGTDLRANVIIAGFVTSYARLELYAGMTFVGIERLLYVDTDCVIALEGPGLPSLPVGECLGEFKSEIDDDRITLFVCGGPKMYAYRTEKGMSVFKAKGITINKGNIDFFTPGLLEEMVRNPEEIQYFLNPYKIFRIRGTWQLTTREETKMVRFTFDKRRILNSTPSYETLPFGYKI